LGANISVGEEENLKEYPQEYPPEMAFVQNMHFRDLRGRLENIQKSIQYLADMGQKKAVGVSENREVNSAALKVLKITGRSVLDVINVIEEKISQYRSQYEKLALKVDTLTEEKEQLQDFSHILEFFRENQIPFRAWEDFKHFAIVLCYFNGQTKKAVDLALNREDAFSAYYYKEIRSNYYMAVIVTLKKYQQMIETLLRKLSARMVNIPAKFQTLNDYDEQIMESTVNELHSDIQSTKQKAIQILEEVLPLIPSIKEVVENISNVVENEEKFQSSPKYKIYRLKMTETHAPELVKRMFAKFKNNIRVQEIRHKQSYKELVPKLDSVETMTRELSKIYSAEIHPEFVSEWSTKSSQIQLEELEQKKEVQL